MKTGNLTLRPFSIVTKVLYDKDTKKATGVEVIDAETNQTYEYKAKVVFLCASCIEFHMGAIQFRYRCLGWRTGQQQWRTWSQSDGSPFPLRRQPAPSEGYEDKYYFGRSANGIYIPRFRNLNGEKTRLSCAALDTRAAQAVTAGHKDVAEMNIGAELKDALTEPGPWTMGATAFGETLPYHENKITLDKNKRQMGSARS